GRSPRPAGNARPRRAGPRRPRAGRNAGATQAARTPAQGRPRGRGRNAHRRRAYRLIAVPRYNGRCRRHPLRVGVVSALVVETNLEPGDRSATRLAGPDRLAVPASVRGSDQVIETLTDADGRPLDARTDPDGRTLL